METLNEYSEMMKKSVGQYTELSKKIQETATSAIEQQIQLTKEFVGWSTKMNSKLMEDFMAYSSSARETMAENIGTVKATIEENVKSAKKSL